MSVMKQYCMGFMFTEDRTKVLLVKKTQGPEALYGLWNGIGGKLEVGETPRIAMHREFAEEVPWQKYSEDWVYFAKMYFKAAWQVHCFSCIVKKPSKLLGANGQPHPPVKNDVGEFVGWMDLNISDVPYNLNWLIPMALHQRMFSIIEEK